MTLQQLKKVIDQNFSEPFLPEGMVKTQWRGKEKHQELEIKIGRRDVTIDTEGKVTGAGTDMLAQKDDSILT